MFFILSKLVYFLLMPAVLISLSVLLAFFFRKTPWKKRFTILAVSLFLLFSNDFIVNELYLFWEIPPSHLSADIEPYDLAVVFTGVTNTSKSPQDRVHFNKGADRVMQAVHLYKTGKVKKILLSGGSGKVWDDGYEEASVLRSVLIECAVAPEDIIIENKAMNTHENAVYSAEIISSQFEKKRILLITSAFHMRRSSGCLSKEKVKFDTYSVDFYSTDRVFTPDVFLIPNEYAMHKWQILIHEVLGFVVYDLVGYL